MKQYTEEQLKVAVSRAVKATFSCSPDVGDAVADFAIKKLKEQESRSYTSENGDLYTYTPDALQPWSLLRKGWVNSVNAGRLELLLVYGRQTDADIERCIALRRPPA